MKYTPRDIPNRPEELAQFLHEELRRISNATGPLPIVQVETSHAAPAKPRAGMIVLADGTDWDPGSGAGYYGYRNGAWVFFG